jgi:hypothetical protein
MVYDQILRNICKQEDLHIQVPVQKFLRNSKHVPDSQEDVTKYKFIADNFLMHRSDVTNSFHLEVEAIWIYSVTGQAKSLE